MVRGDNLICGTSTTGTGTLTLAATPVPPGGVDFDVFARATGIGFGNSAVILVTYTIIEYVDSTFASAKATEKGVGTLTLGGSSGIANATLARTTLQTTATSLNSQPATQNIGPVSGISIGTAANTLIFIGASAAEIPAYSPYVQSAVGDASYACPLVFGGSQGGATMTSGTIYWQNFCWVVPMLVKSCEVLIATAYAGGTPVSNLNLRLYDVGTDGRPGKLLLDFGLAGSSNASMNSASIIHATNSNGYFLSPGDYWLGACPVFSGGSTGPGFQVIGGAGGIGTYISPGRAGVNLAVPFMSFTSTGGTIGAAPDPDPLTSWAGSTSVTSGPPIFAFKAS